MTSEATRPEEQWDPLTPEQVKQRLEGIAVPWWIAGGWALDLFMGRQIRAHEDIEISVYRDDVAALRSHLRSLEFFIADRGTLTPWSDGALPDAAHALWSRERGRLSWQLEVLVEERRGGRWVYRRDEDIGVHAGDIGRVTAEGIPYLRPDIVLLYKSKEPRPKDETDFITVVPRLDPAQRSFLAAALWTTAPGHRWLGRLQ